VAVGDFNGDGKSDLVVANAGVYDQNSGAYTNSGVSVLLGKGDGTFQPAVKYGNQRSAIAVGDFDSDGKADLAVADASGLSILLGKSDGTFLATGNYAAGIGPSSVAVGDFDDDGRADLIAVNFSSANVSVLLGHGDGTFQAAVNSSAGPGPFSVGDLNGDGKLDLVVADSYQRVSVWLGSGDGTFQSPVNFSAGVFPVSVAMGDFNGDGASDLVVANGNGSSSVSVLLNTCVPTSTRVAIGRNNNTIIVSWPSASTGFVLESTTSLNQPSWQGAAEVPTTNNGRLVVSVPLIQQERYFRLRKP
jgi:hypothetical protein